MTCDPTNVGNTTEYIAWFVTKNILEENERALAWAFRLGSNERIKL
jgi:hypothetical protein